MKETDDMSNCQHLLRSAKGYSRFLFRTTALVFDVPGSCFNIFVFGRNRR